jgi:hypothetical protein
MSSLKSPAVVPPNYRSTLTRTLELAMKTAETASVESNHRVVLQAVREVTRIITLMTKLDFTSAAENEAQPIALPPPTELLAPSHLAPSTSPPPAVVSPRSASKRKKAGKKAKNRREKTGKLPATDQLLDDIIVKFNTLKLYEDNAAQALAAAG